VQSSTANLVLSLNCARTAADNTAGSARSDIGLLTARIRAGDEEAFREFHQRYFDRLYQFLIGVTRGREDEARDALQETMVRVVRYIRRFEDEEAFWSWLRAVARSAARDNGRRQVRYLGLLQRFALHLEQAADEPADPLAALPGGVSLRVGPSGPPDHRRQIFAGFERERAGVQDEPHRKGRGIAAPSFAQAHAREPLEKTACIMRDKDKLLADILSDEDVAELRHASLSHGLRAMRRQRRRRVAWRAGVTVIATGLIGLAMLWTQRSSPIERQMANAPPGEVRSWPESSGRVEFISDEELLALFPNRPVALIGKPGRQRLVFLDRDERRMPQE
jgi:RNA polymerase sigma factor (sigma-70 family)